MLCLNCYDDTSTDKLTGVLEVDIFPANGINCAAMNLQGVLQGVTISSSRPYHCQYVSSKCFLQS